MRTERFCDKNDNCEEVPKQILMVGAKATRQKKKAWRRWNDYGVETDVTANSSS
jgi:hypothetical protein